MMKMILPVLIFLFILPKQKYLYPILSLLTLLWILLNPFSFSVTNWNLYLFSDFLSFSMVILTLMSFLLICFSSYNLNKIFCLISCITFFLLISFFSSNIILFYISFEAVLVPTLFLITINGKAPERIQAGIYLLIYTIFGSLPLLLGILWIPSNSFTLLCMNLPFFSLPLIFLIAFLVKLPMFFFHLWLPKAHVEAPLEGSMVLAAVLLKLGGYGIIRFSPFIQKISLTFSSSIISISLLGALFTSMNCSRQKDIKALIAYSSVAHMAMVIAALVSFKPMGTFAAILMMLAHGLTSSALFFLVTILYNLSHSRNILLFKGILLVFPNLTFWWFVFSALNISAPPSINMVSEIIIFSSLVQIDLMNSLFIFLASIFTATFSIILYSNISHNSNSNFLTSSNIPKKSYSGLFLHFLPISISTLKPEIFIY